MKIIETNEISKRYIMGSEVIDALKSVTISINKGEYVAFMGPSGSGKSTLMNIVGCLDTPTSGTYVLNGQDVSKMDENELAEIRNKEILYIQPLPLSSKQKDWYIHPAILSRDDVTGVSNSLLQLQTFRTVVMYVQQYGAVAHASK